MTNNNVDNAIKLTQEGLTKQIIEALNIEHLPRKLTLSMHEPLTNDKNGSPADAGVYSYTSVIGIILQFCEGHLRPDITHAVSQCARFTNSPK